MNRVTVTSSAVINLFLIVVSSAEDQPFQPIPDAKKPLYRFDLEKWFYADEAARQTDLARLRELTDQIIALKPAVRVDATKLLAAIETRQQMGMIADRLQAYGGLRWAINTVDPVAQREKKQGSDARDNFDADAAFVQSAVQALDDDTLRRFIAAAPGLGRYEFLLRSWRRMKPHTAAEPAEEAINKLASGLDPFQGDFYELMLGRSPGAVITIGDRSFRVTKPGDYAELLRLPDRTLRETAFRKRSAIYKAEGDLFAYGLLQKARTANTVSAIRHFPTAIHEELFGYFLSPEAVDTVLQGFRDHADLAIRFQKAERRYQAKLLGIDSAEPWDLEARPATLPEPRFDIDAATLAVREAIKGLGVEYSAELNHLLDPNNGRLDIVKGPNRRSGDFTWGAYGPSWVFYMQGYNGFLSDVVTFAHEAAHGVHFRLLNAAGVPWSYGEGAPYFTEGVAKVNELLILDFLAKSAKTDAERLYYLRQLTSKLASVKFTAMYWAAYATSFEFEVYRREKSGKLQGPDDIHDIWAEYGRMWTYHFDRFPDSKYTWADTHHFFDAPRYYSNYLFAWLFALSIYERVQSDPVAAEKLISLMKAGYSDEPAVLLQKHLGVDLADPAMLARLFAVVEKRVSEFENQVATMNK